MKTMKILISLIIFSTSIALRADSIVDQYYLKLTEKRGTMVGVWNHFIAQAKKQNVKAMDSIFQASSRRFSGFYLSTYKYNLFDVFQHNPKFFIKRGKAYFKDQGLCNMYWLLPKTKETEPEQVYSALKKAKLMSDLSLAKSFVKYSEEKRHDTTKHCRKLMVDEKKLQEAKMKIKENLENYKKKKNKKEN